MDLSFAHFAIICCTVAIVIGGGIYAARSVHSAEGYSLGGRSAGALMVAGSIAGTCVGGGATVGTAQLAYSQGLSAWWFTLGSGISFILMGLFYARPLRKTSLETIPQYLALHYGQCAGALASVISSLGIFFSAVASTLPGIQLIAALFGVPSWAAAILLILLVAAYVFFGGMRSAGVGGMLKMVVIWVSLFVAGFSAFWAIHAEPEISAAFAGGHWFDLIGEEDTPVLANLISLIVGILCTQSYIQVIFSAASPRTAAIGTLLAACIAIPVGLPCAMIGMYMHAVQPDVLPILALPTYLLEHQPVIIGAIAMGGIVVSLISSIAGLSLGIGTMISHDLLAPRMPRASDKARLRTHRLVVLIVMACAAGFAMLNENSQVLFWNYLSMGLRSGGVFLPLTIAVFAPLRIDCRWVVASMVCSTAAAILATVLHSPVHPLFIGLAVSLVFLIFGRWHGAR